MGACISLISVDVSVGIGKPSSTTQVWPSLHWGCSDCTFHQSHKRSKATIATRVRQLGSAPALLHVMHMAVRPVLAPAPCHFFNLWAATGSDAQPPAPDYPA